MGNVVKLSKFFSPAEFLEAYILVLEKYLELKKTEEIERTKRLKIEKDIQTLKLFVEKKQRLIQTLFDKKLAERNKQLDLLLEEIDKHIDNPKLVSIFLKAFEKILLSPVVTKKKLSN